MQQLVLPTRQRCQAALVVLCAQLITREHVGRQVYCLVTAATAAAAGGPVRMGARAGQGCLLLRPSRPLLTRCRCLPSARRLAPVLQAPLLLAPTWNFSCAACDGLMSGWWRAASCR